MLTFSIRTAMTQKLLWRRRYKPLVDTVRQGKALYIGISRWPLEATKTAITYLRDHDTPLLIYQGRLNMLDHEPIDEGILDLCHKEEWASSPSRHWLRACSPTAT